MMLFHMLTIIKLKTTYYVHIFNLFIGLIVTFTCYYLRSRYNFIILFRIVYNKHIYKSRSEIR